MFDSGFGGLTVARAMIDLLPNENLIYFGDTARYPYGPRPISEVAEFATQIAGWLTTKVDAKAVVVACNTAAAAALGALEEMLEVPVIGVIDPGVRATLAATESGRVGVIATVTTVASGAYQQAFGVHKSELVCAACPGFVEFVERGETYSDQLLVLAERLLAPVIDADVDALLLGCTHYPFLSRVINKVMGRNVTLVSSADETAFEVYSMISNETILPASDSVGTHRWCSTGDAQLFERLGTNLAGMSITTAEHIDLCELEEFSS